MSSPNNTALAYCSEDRDLALKIEKDLGAVASFTHFSPEETKDATVLSELMDNFRGFAILLVTDNFLRSPNCLLNGNRLLSGNGKETLVVMADTQRFEKSIGEWVEAPLRLEKQKDVMQYINHWQERYLDLRRQKNELSAEGGEAFDRYLSRLREVSGQVNDFLHYLKDGLPLRWPEFISNDYQQFFIFTERTEEFAAFKAGQHQSEEVTPPVDLASIPGMDQLPTEETEQELEAEAPPIPEPSQEDTPDPVPTSIVEPQPEAIEESIEAPEEPTLSEAEEANTYIRRAWALVEDGNLDVALDLLRGGREALPENQEIHYHYALMLATEAMDPQGAREEVDALLSVAPDHQDALYLSGELYYDKEDFGSARFAWEHLSDEAPNYPDLNTRLGLLIADHFSEDAFDAAAYLRRATKSDEASADTYFRYALLLANHLDKPAKAKKALGKALDIDPSHAKAQYELAVLLHAAGDTALARAAYARAKSLQPDFATPENEAAFLSPSISTQPMFMSDAEAGALTALKENIAQLEAMIQQREAEAAAREAAAEAEKAAAPGHGKIVLISGATSGIGLATARRFAAAGFSLILTGRRSDRLQELKNELKETHETDVKTLRFDVRDREAVNKNIEGLPQKWQDIDILINNAGKAKGFDPIHEGSFEHWDEMIDTNLRGLLYLTRAISPGMVERGEGLIINVCSTAGKEVYPKGNVYCATKHAVDALTHGMRLDLVEHGVRVGQVCPAHVEETEFALVRFDGDEKRAEKVYENFQPLTSPDVAETIFWMATQPPHVNILDVVLQGKQQASSTVVDRSGR